jgi:hypothetical protein
MANIAKQVRQAEKEAIQVEMDIMWHERAKRHRGFTNYSGLMTQEELANAKERRKGLRAFVANNRKKVKSHAK